ncbi:MAG: family transcriptional regulator [Mucilaginibacter sp.]|nr:family transcriptional regulator [Mucilaginibacter sp.]
MEALKYKIIKTEEQYWEYCDKLELLVSNKGDDGLEDEIELLTFLIEKWDEEHSTLNESDPVELLKYLMDENKMKAKTLADVLGISKSTVSEILHYRKGLSKEIIRKLADRFKVRQEAFNRPYKLISAANSHLRNAVVMNTTKAMTTAN